MRVNTFPRHWKRKPENFQALENLPAVAFGEGGSRRNFSKPWNFSRGFFQALENLPDIFPRLGKHSAARYESTADERK
jgi:hypothetical protein